MEKREIINLFQNFKQETEELGKIILPIIEKYNLPPKEIIEVCQIGKFIYKLNENLQIIDKPSPPRPDFILQNNLQLIGLEHTRIFTENSEKYNRIKSLFEYSEKIFNQLFPNEKIHASITIYNDSFEYKQFQKKELANKISTYIQSLILNEKSRKARFY